MELQEMDKVLSIKLYSICNVTVLGLVIQVLPYLDNAWGHDEDAYFADHSWPQHDAE